jgi:nucleoside 2-deoxyribosyltransferase
MKKIYIAGFDVFKSSAKQIGKEYKHLCEKFGYEGLYPLDNEIETSWSKQRVREFIYQSNINLIKKCNIVIANANPFRGEELDSGTAFEIGYAKALKKEVILYMDDIRDYKEKLTCKLNEKYDKEGMSIEDFGLPLNLMFSDCKVVQGGFEEAMKTLNF